MRKKTFYLSSYTSLIFLVGCTFFSEPYRGVRYFDLGVPDGQYKNVSEINVTGSASYRFSFVYRKGSNEILKDEYNKWSVSPENLVECYLKNMFPIVGGEGERISIVLNVFEFNLGSKKAILKANGRIKGDTGTSDFVVDSETVFTGNTPEALVSAMRGNIDKLAESINDKISSKKGK